MGYALPSRAVRGPKCVQALADSGPGAARIGKRPEIRNNANSN